MEKRFDAGTAVSIEKTPQGFYKIRGRFARSGIQVYRRMLQDGTSETVREYRSPEEVFRADSLESYRNAPITDLHPEEFVVMENAPTYKRGHAYDAKQDEKDPVYVFGKGIVDHLELARKLDNGERVEVSCGYTADIIFEPGVTPEGEEYDARQENIVINHIALLPRGQARGGPNVRLDSKEVYGVEKTSEGAKGDNMEIKTIKIAEIECRVDAAQAEFIEKALSEEKARFDGLESQIAQQTARADAAEKSLSDLKGDFEAYKAGEAERIKEISKLREDASKILDSEELGDLSGRDLKEAVVRKYYERTDSLEGLHDEYINCMFDLAVAGAKENKSEKTDAISGGTGEALKIAETKRDRGEGKDPIQKSVENTIAKSREPFAFSKRA